jgi:hypothetical protein
VRIACLLFPVEALSNGWSKINHGDFSALAGAVGLVVGGVGVWADTALAVKNIIAERDKDLCIETNNSPKK